MGYICLVVAAAAAATGGSLVYLLGGSLPGLGFRLIIDL